MNERVKGLAEQAWAYVMVCDERYSKLSTQLFNEKFAELIVRECMAAVQKEKDTGMYDAHEMAGMSVSKAIISFHFGGVEE